MPAPVCAVAASEEVETWCLPRSSVFKLTRMLNDASCRRASCFWSGEYHKEGGVETNNLVDLSNACNDAEKLNSDGQNKNMSFPDITDSFHEKLQAATPMVGLRAFESRARGIRQNRTRKTRRREKKRIEFRRDESKPMRTMKRLVEETSVMDEEHGIKEGFQEKARYKAEEANDTSANKGEIALTDAEERIIRHDLSQLSEAFLSNFGEDAGRPWPRTLSINLGNISKDSRGFIQERISAPRSQSHKDEKQKKKKKEMGLQYRFGYRTFSFDEYSSRSSSERKESFTRLISMYRSWTTDEGSKETEKSWENNRRAKRSKKTELR
jgi:hypothetical protein